MLPSGVGTAATESCAVGSGQINVSSRAKADEWACETESRTS